MNWLLPESKYPNIQISIYPKWHKIMIKSRFWDVEMELRDVGCVRISFAMNSEAVWVFSIWKSIKSWWNLFKIHILALFSESETVMVDGIFFGDFFKQDRSWDDYWTTISGIHGTHQNSIRVRMPVLIVVPRVNSKLSPFWSEIIWKSYKSCFFFESYAFLRKKTPGRAAPHRRPSWGCTKTKKINEVH